MFYLTSHQDHDQKGPHLTRTVALSLFLLSRGPVKGHSICTTSQRRDDELGTISYSHCLPLMWAHSGPLILQTAGCTTFHLGAVTHHIITLAMCFKEELPTGKNPLDPNPSSRSRIQGAVSSLGDPSMQGQGLFLQPESLPEKVSHTISARGAAGARA